MFVAPSDDHPTVGERRNARVSRSPSEASLDERARSRRQGRQPREAGAERSDAP